MNQSNEEHQRNIIHQSEPSQPCSTRATVPTRKEVDDAVNLLKSGKSAGIDRFTIELFKYGGEQISIWLHSVISHIWITKKIPHEFTEAIIILLHKKGDRRICHNARPISLLSIPGRVLMKIIQTRVEKKVELHLRDNQNGFRSKRGTGDSIFGVHQVIEKTREYNKHLYVLSIDFSKAFDCISREKLWTVLPQYDIDEEITTLIRNIYNGSTARIQLNSGAISEPFNITSGVRQGCILSPLLFSIIINEIMREATQNLSDKESYLYLNNSRLYDFDYADDLAIFSESLEGLEALYREVKKVASDWLLKINCSKTKIMHICRSDTNIQNGTTVSLDGDSFEAINSFKYLGSIISRDGSSRPNVEKRIMMGNTVFQRMKTFFRRKRASLHLRKRVFNTCVLSVLLYGSESWTLTPALYSKLESFQNQCLRDMLNLTWEDKISNKELHQRVPGYTSIASLIRRRRLRWFGKLLNMEESRICKQLLKWKPEGRRPRGRPPKSWISQVQKDLQKSDIVEFTELLKNGIPEGVAWSDVWWIILSSDWTELS